MKKIRESIWKGGRVYNKLITYISCEWLKIKILFVSAHNRYILPTYTKINVYKITWVKKNNFYNLQPKFDLKYL